MITAQSAEQPPAHWPECQSANHAECYGDLWQCTRCGKTVCFAEGTTDKPELCDDCWCAVEQIVA